MGCHALPIHQSSFSYNQMFPAYFDPSKMTAVWQGSKTHIFTVVGLNAAWKPWKHDILEQEEILLDPLAAATASLCKTSVLDLQLILHSTAVATEVAPGHH